MDLSHRVAVHHALADEHRLRIVDALALSDLTPTELGAVVGLASNLLAFHLDTLEAAGLVERRPSEGDRRRRYVGLRPEALAAATAVDPAPYRAPATVLFVCTRNSARSQLAAALWQRHGGVGASAGQDPAEQVHPLAVRVGQTHGLDLTRARPQGYADVEVKPGLVVSVCDRAREAEPPFDAPLLHWSVPDPANRGRRRDFEDAYAVIERRVARLAGLAAA